MLGETYWGKINLNKITFWNDHKLRLETSRNSKSNIPDHLYTLKKKCDETF